MAASITNSPALVLPAPSTETNAVAEVDIRGIKPPVAISSSWAWLGWVLAAAALIALIVWAWKKWRVKKANAVAVKIDIPPHERARRKLEKALELLDQPKPFCTLVSDAVRLYLEERFTLNAPDRTTEEFLDDLQSAAVLTFTQKQMLADFLMRCDLVKFARHEPPASELQELYQSALRLIQETEPPPPLPDVGQHANTANAR